MLTDQEKYVIALCAWKEAEGEGIAGCVEVMHVILNRSREWNQTVNQVIYRKNQFSWTSPSSPRYATVPKDSDPVWLACLADVEELETADDPTEGATFYWNPKTETSPWFEKHIAGSPEFEISARSVHHVFYRKVQQ